MIGHSVVLCNGHSKWIQWQLIQGTLSGNLDKAVRVCVCVRTHACLHVHATYWRPEYIFLWQSEDIFWKLGDIDWSWTSTSWWGAQVKVRIGFKFGCWHLGAGDCVWEPSQRQKYNRACVCLLKHKEGLQTSSRTGKREGTTDGQRGEEKTDGEQGHRMRYYTEHSRTHWLFSLFKLSFSSLSELFSEF